MKQFSQLGAKPITTGLVGEKIQIHKIFNCPIEVHGFKVEDSKFEGKGKCLYMQIKYADNMRVVFTSSKVLMETIQQIAKEDFPFSTTIIRENDRFEFS